jgi:hypothetical protein
MGLVLSPPRGMVTNTEKNTQKQKNITGSKPTVGDGDCSHGVKASLVLFSSEPTVWDGDIPHLQSLIVPLGLFRAHRVGW